MSQWSLGIFIWNKSEVTGVIVLTISAEKGKEILMILIFILWGGRTNGLSSADVQPSTAHNIHTGTKQNHHTCTITHTGPYDMMHWFFELTIVLFHAGLSEYTSIESSPTENQCKLSLQVVWP